MDELKVMDNLSDEQEEAIKKAAAERKELHEKAEEQKRFQAALAEWDRACGSLREAYEVEMASLPEDVRMRGRLQAAIGRYERFWDYATTKCYASTELPFWMAAAKVALGRHLSALSRIRKGKGRRNKNGNGNADSFKVESNTTKLECPYLRPSSCAITSFTPKPVVIGSIRFDKSMAVEVIGYDKKTGNYEVLVSEGFKGMPKGMRWRRDVCGFDNLARLVSEEEWAKHIHASKARKGCEPGTTKGWAYLPKLAKTDLEAMADALFGPLDQLPKRPEYPAKPVLATA